MPLSASCISTSRHDCYLLPCYDRVVTFAEEATDAFERLLRLTLQPRLLLVLTSQLRHCLQFLKMSYSLRRKNRTDCRDVSVTKCIRYRNSTEMLPWAAETEGPFVAWVAVWGFDSNRLGLRGGGSCCGTGRGGKGINSGSPGVRSPGSCLEPVLLPLAGASDGVCHVTPRHPAVLPVGSFQGARFCSRSWIFG